MSDSLAFVLAVSLGEILPAGISLYAGYWAFSIRKALAGRIYRNHALWLGAFCVPFAVSSFITYTNSPIISELLDVYFAALILTVFAWVDSTIPVARRSDPLLRNILRWDKVRLVVWPVLFGLAAVILYLGATVNFTTNPPLLFFQLLLAFILGPFVIGAPAMLIGARRSGDLILRGSLKWFGILLLMLLLSIVISTVIEQGIFGVSNYDLYYSYPALPGAVFIILAAYSLYKSARSLAPTNKLALSD
jgi:hypothetical protein